MVLRNRRSHVEYCLDGGSRLSVGNPTSIRHRLSNFVKKIFAQFRLYDATIMQPLRG